MTDYASLYLPDRGQDAHDIHIVDKAGFDGWLAAQPAPARGAAMAQRVQSFLVNEEDNTVLEVTPVFSNSSAQRIYIRSPHSLR